MISDDLDKYFEQIKSELYISLSEGRGGPFGAGILLNGELIAIGTNEVLKTGDVSRHAEVVTISRATKKLASLDLSDAILLTTHYPCMMCYHALKWAGIKKAYFVFSIEETEQLFSFYGDSRFITDLGLSMDSLNADPSLSLERHSSEYIRESYFKELVEEWNDKYLEKLSSYDVSRD